MAEEKSRGNGNESGETTKAEIEIKCAYTALVDIEKVVPNPRNPNTHPDNQIELLAKIIRATGFRNPIVVSKRSGFITKGHGRYLAAQLLGMEAVPVDCQDYESEAQEWQDMIADNRIAELAEMDVVKEQELLDELIAAEEDLELCGVEDFEPLDFNDESEMDISDFIESNQNRDGETSVKRCPHCGKEI